jgi:hypothetical protein
MKLVGVRAVCRKKLTVDFNGGRQSSNGGLLLVREVERQLGVCWRLADAMPDCRGPDRIRHAMFEMVMARAAAIACGYKDANDLGPAAPRFSDEPCGRALSAERRVPGWQCGSQGCRPKRCRLFKSICVRKSCFETRDSSVNSFVHAT